MTEKNVDIADAFAQGATLELVTKREGSPKGESVAAVYPTQDGGLNTQLRTLVEAFATGSDRNRPLITNSSYSLRVDGAEVFASQPREPLPLTIGTLQRCITQAAHLSPVPKT